MEKKRSEAEWLQFVEENKLLLMSIPTPGDRERGNLYDKIKYGISRWSKHSYLKLIRSSSRLVEDIVSGKCDPKVLQEIDDMSNYNQLADYLWGELKKRKPEVCKLRNSNGWSGNRYEELLKLENDYPRKFRQNLIRTAKEISFRCNNKETGDLLEKFHQEIVDEETKWIWDFFEIEED